jgi:predicted Zn-dependent protease
MKNAPLLALIPLVAASCAVNPATGERELMLVSESQELAMGRQYDPQVVAAFGIYPDSGVQAYLRDIGESMAAVSERPHLPWTFRVVDDPIVNAFAVPGGYIYITRGIMVHLNSEAELASVLGHEIGHVTARHSAQQMTQLQLAQVGLAAGAVLVPQAQDYLGVAGAGLQLLFLKFGRDDEEQSDDLALRYMSRTGYDVRESPDVYEMLRTVSAASGGGSVPTWLSTHPDPENRRQRILQQIDSMPAVPDATVNHAEYLERLDGMVYGINPREGFFRDNVFMHPDLAFRMDFPAGWQTANSKQAVAAQSPEEDAVLRITVADASSPRAAANALLQQEGISGGPVHSGDINGLDAAVTHFSAVTEEGTSLRGLAGFVSHGGLVYWVMGLTLAERWNAYRPVFQESFGSFRRLADRSAFAVQPLRLEIVRLPRAMTLREFSESYPSQVPLESLALLNQANIDAALPRGALVKRVVGGPLP